MVILREGSFCVFLRNAQSIGEHPNHSLMVEFGLFLYHIQQDRDLIQLILYCS